MMLEVIVGVIVLVLSHLISGLSEAYDKTKERKTSSSSTKSRESDPPLSENTHGEDERFAEPPQLPQPDHCTMKEYVNRPQLSEERKPPQLFSQIQERDTSSAAEEFPEIDLPSSKMVHTDHEEVDGSAHSVQTGHCTVNDQDERTWLLLQETQPSQLPHQNPQTEDGSLMYDSQEGDKPTCEMIHREYEHVDGSDFSSVADPHIDADKPTDKVKDIESVTSSNKQLPGFCQSLQRSLEASFTIMVAVLPLGLLGILLLYHDLNTTNLCFEWNHRFDNLSTQILRWKVFGEVIQDIPINLWFAATMALLFGWREFRSNYNSTMYVGLAVGVTIAIYKIFLLIFGVFGTRLYYRYPGNILFLVGIIYSSVLVARKIHDLSSSVPSFNFEITVVMISNHFITSFISGMIYRYSTVPQFIETKTEMMRAVLAAVPPLLALIPTAISKYFVLRYSSDIIQGGRGFVLAYFAHGFGIILYRTMQADFSSLWIFTGLSLIHGLLNFAGKATQKFLVGMLARLIDRLKNPSASRRLESIRDETPHHRRLKADLQIQDMLFEDTALILSQAYRVLYLITSFENSHAAVLKESLIRVSIGLGIDFIFNCLSTFVHIFWFNIPIRRVCLENCKLHMVAQAIVITITVCYFSPVLLSVFQVRSDNSPEEFTVRNCTLFFKKW